MMILPPEDVPNRMVFDLEIARPIPTNRQTGRTNWDKAHKCGISTLCGWPMAGIHPYIWMLDTARLPRVFFTEAHAKLEFEQCDGVITWNGVSFDNRLMKESAPEVYEIYHHARKKVPLTKHVDLMAIASLLQAGVDPEKLADGVPDDWHKLCPGITSDFLNKGWNLDATARETLGMISGKMKGFDGAKAPQVWQQGRYSEVGSYCLGDVALTRAVYLHVWIHGWIKSPERGRVEVPRLLL